MSETNNHSAIDWAGSLRGYAIAWGVPIFAIITGSFADVPTRATIWSLALFWMGAACLVNARRCGRVHCRFTGPFYLILIVPVILLGMDLLPLGPYGWWILGAVALFGGKIIWWITETAWGTYVERKN